MRITNLFLGLVVSGVVHVLVLLPGTGSGAPERAAEAEPTPTPRIVLTAAAESGPDAAQAAAAEPEPLPPPPEPEPVPEPEPPPPVVAPAEPVVAEPVVETSGAQDEPEQQEPPLELAQEHEGAAAEPASAGPGPGTIDGPVSLRPELVLSWDGPEHLLAVARREGFRVVAVGTDGKIAGEVREGESTLAAFRSRVGLFSNRVRALPKDFFPGLVLGANTVREFWVLVPVAADRRLTARTNDAAADEGLTPANVRAVHARYASDGRGGYELRVQSVDRR